MGDFDFHRPWNWQATKPFMGEGNGTPLQYSCLENPMDGEAWCTAVHGVTRRRTRLSDFTFTFHFHALEKEMATHSSVLAWRWKIIESRKTISKSKLWSFETKLFQIHLSLNANQKETHAKNIFCYDLSSVFYCILNTCIITFQIGSSSGHHCPK